MMRVDGKNAWALNIRSIEALAVPAKGNKFYGYSGAEAQGMKAPGGFGVVVTASGVKSFVLNYRIAGRERCYTIGRCSTWRVPKAIKTARELRQRIDTGDDLDRAPVAGPVKQPTIKDIDEAWLKSPKRRDKPNTPQRSSFARRILPFKLGDGRDALKLGDMPYPELRKSQVAGLRDKITAQAGPYAANRAVTYLSSVLKWQEARDDDWTAPSFAVLKLENPETARNRPFCEDEITKLWPALQGEDLFGSFCRLPMLTGQRRNDIGNAMWSQIDRKARTLTIPPERYRTGYKTGADQVVPLTDATPAILDALPRRRNGRVFPVSNYSQKRAIVDKAVRPGARRTLHDLRRTAKTIMARAGVRPDISERVLGHVVPGVEGVYNRHDYLAEKRDALERLDAALDRILHPTESVIELVRV